jgi:hypothetical protein
LVTAAAEDVACSAAASAIDSNTVADNGVAADDEVEVTPGVEVLLGGDIDGSAVTMAAVDYGPSAAGFRGAR